jgi:4'-phosphopantetheinyl transferase
MKMSTLDQAATKPSTLDQAEVHVWTCRLDAAPDAIAYWTTLLADDEMARAARFRVSTDRDRFIVAHALLRRLLATYLETDPARLLFGQAAFGKPFLIDHPELCFSLSHSGDFALVALARCQVGVDVERLDQQIEIDGVAASAFSALELAELRTLVPAERRAAFFRLWTRKEAYVKARGEGLRRPTYSFSVSSRAGDDDALLSDAIDSEAGQGWRVGDIAAPAGYCAALAVAQRVWPVQQFDAAVLPPRFG